MHVSKGISPTTKLKESIMKIKDFLTESNWGKGQYAEDADGNVFTVQDTKGVKFCLIGAAMRCYPDPDALAYIHQVLDLEIYDMTVVKWNDMPERTFAEVKAVIEKLDI